jgi:predicted nucleotide-binding protein (sugar kinase/HSP70/actin superfamily)
VPECPPILDPEIDLTEGRHRLRQIIHNLGRHFSSDKVKIETAAEEAEKVHLAYRKEMSDRGITPVQALDELFQSEKESDLELGADTALSVAVIGHQYVIYDDYINHRFISRLQDMGARVFTPEMAAQEDLDFAMTKLVGKPHWSFEVDIIGAGEHYLEAKVDGIISVAVFGCGPDSMMIDIVRHRARECKIPFLHISLDEHTSDGGLVTRLEAFLDMVKRRKRVCA